MMFRERVFKRIRSLFNRQDQYLDHNQKINLPFFNRLKPLTKNRISYVLSCFFLLISKRERDRSHSGWQTYSWLPIDTFYLYFHKGLGLPQVLKKGFKKNYRTQKSTQKRRCTQKSTKKSTHKINKKSSMKIKYSKK